MAGNATSNTRTGRRSSPGDIAVSPSDHQFLEFHRQAAALLPDPEDPRPGIAVIAPGKRAGSRERSCTCSGLFQSGCLHVKRLEAILDHYVATLDCKDMEEDFKGSVWYRLATCLGEDSDEDLASCSTHRENTGLIIKDKEGRNLVSYRGRGQDAERLFQRFQLRFNKHEVPTRGAILQKLRHLTLTDTELMLLERGHQSRRYALEGTFWFRFAYHCYREFGRSGIRFRPAVNHRTGEFVLTCLDGSGPELFHLFVPRDRVKRLLDEMKDSISNQYRMPVHPIPLKTIFKISRNTELDLDIRPQIRMIQEQGESRFFEQRELERFRYGDLVYIKELGILARLEPPGSERRFRAPVKTVLKKHRIPEFLEELAQDDQNDFVLDDSARELRILDGPGRLEISPDAIERDWCWLSAEYSVEEASVSLAEILEARSQGKRFINTKRGWLDCMSPALDHLDEIFDKDVARRIDKDRGRIRLSRMELLRLCALGKGPGHRQAGTQAFPLKDLAELIPPEDVPCPGGLTSPLRRYQETGMKWAYYLFRNGLGGLLCDDMGLGKTHQVMALILLILEKEAVQAPFLVVCPTTVLSHWEQKLRIHAPGLQTVVYHGQERSLGKDLDSQSVILTSYGLLWRDISRLEELSFTLAVFDEIQHIKNPATKAYAAARALRARMKLGLTGTPIENSLWELKALLDLVLPGYLGTDRAFQRRYMDAPEEGTERSRREELRSLVSPLILRRLKGSVLNELPEKIEDVMACRLSDQQVKLYRDAISSRGKELIDMLGDRREPIPYMHIFALLNLLKQICDHPALVLKDLENYKDYSSGKWDLFNELLGQAMDSGQKVVVFSQYVGMINIMERHLEGSGIGFVSLTGSSRNRKEIISRFNTDPECRVILASLKAGGTGIDLISGSTVIHYDRWWNAAREDQATDRAYRIGQKKVVQVFKLTTIGTLEEKISAIIDRKRNLMDEVVEADSPEIIKAFSRKDLEAILRQAPG